MWPNEWTQNRAPKRSASGQFIGAAPIDHCPPVCVACQRRQHLHFVFQIGKLPLLLLLLLLLLSCLDRSNCFAAARTHRRRFAGASINERAPCACFPFFQAAVSHWRQVSHWPYFRSARTQSHFYTLALAHKVIFHPLAASSHSRIASRCVAKRAAPSYPAQISA